MVEEIFQCASNRSPVYRTGDYYSVGTPHALDQPGGVVAVLLGRAAIRESYPLVRKIYQLNIETLLRSLHAVEQPPRCAQQSPRRRNAPHNRLKFDRHLCYPAASRDAGPSRRAASRRTSGIRWRP